jgi:hypothetical protein
LHSVSVETFTFAAIERIASHCESYSAWRASTNAIATIDRARHASNSSSGA